MFFLNLTLPEFLAVLGAASAVVVALYLLDRTQKQVLCSDTAFFRGCGSRSGVEASP